MQFNILNDNGSTESLSNHFVSIAISHGNRPEHASYSYVVMPGKGHTTKEHPAMEFMPWNILSNTEKIQAAEEIFTGLLGINFWEPGTLELAEEANWTGRITADSPCSVIMKKEQGKLFVGISDPAHQMPQIRVYLPGRYKICPVSKTIEGIEETTEGNEGIWLVVTTRQSSGGTTHSVILE